MITESLDIIHCPIFLIKNNVSDTGLYIHPQENAHSVGLN